MHVGERANTRIRESGRTKFYCQSSFFRIFLESNTDRNTRIFLAVAVAYFAYFGPSFRIPVFGGFVSSVLDSAGHAAAAC